MIQIGLPAESAGLALGVAGGAESAPWKKLWSLISFCCKQAISKTSAQPAL